MRSLCTSVFHRLEIVVHAREQDTLVAQRDAVVCQSFERDAHFRREFARVIDVDAHPERMILLQHRAKLRRDPLREKDRHTGTDTKKFDMRDRAQPAEDFLQLRIAEKQRVTAGEKHVAHFGVFFEITKRGFEFGVQFLFAHSADDPAPGTIAAVARATIGHEKQDAIGITMDQTRDRHVRIFAARVRHVVGRRPGLLDPRDDLAPDRAIGIVRLDQVEKMRRDRKSEFVARKQHARPLRLGKNEMFLELGERSDAVLQLPFPVIPEFGRNIGEVSGRVGDELFSVLFAVGKSEHFDLRNKS